MMIADKILLCVDFLLYSLIGVTFSFWPFDCYATQTKQYNLQDGQEIFYIKTSDF